MKEYLNLLKCPTCEGVVNDAQASRTYVAPFNAHQYTLHRCENCDLSFWTPLRIDPAFYEDEGFAAYADYHKGGRPFPPWCALFFEKMPLVQGRLLDVGCGDGAFLARAKAAGFETWGMDLDKNSVNAAVTHYRLDNIKHSSLDEFVGFCKKNAITFDIISFFEVLEHQDHPAEFINQVISVLKPGGYIAGSVPNARRFLAALDRRLSPGDLPPHHFLWFTKRTLKLFFSSKQFDSILVQPSGNISFAELRAKFTALVYKKTLVQSPSWLTRFILFPAIQCVTYGLWIGYRFSPAHLYFQASKPLILEKNG